VARDGRRGAPSQVDPRALDLVGRLAAAELMANRSHATAFAEKAADIENAAHLARDLAFKHLARSHPAAIDLRLSDHADDDKEAWAALESAIRTAGRASASEGGLRETLTALLDTATGQFADFNVTKPATVRHLYADKLQALALELQVAAWSLREPLSAAPTPKRRGRPKAHAWDRCATAAAEAGLTPMQLARAAVATEWIRHALSIDKNADADAVRKRFAHHWPTSSAQKSKRR
jgi:hypothetical protein